MLTTLLRHFRGLPLLVLALLCLGRMQQAQASHLYGGEMSYRYLDANGPVGNPFRYEVTVSIYNNSGNTSQVPNGRPDIELGFYLKNGTRIVLPATMPLSPGSSLTTAGNPQNPRQAGNVVVNQTTNNSVTRVIPTACANGFTPPSVRLVRYVTVVCLPVSVDGYYCFYSDNSRTANITNLQNNGTGSAGAGNMTLYLDMAGPLIPNSAPVFSDTAVALVCQFDTTFILNSASDADGDRLTYSFGTPYAGDYNQQGTPPTSPNYNPPFTFTPPPPSVNYAAGYSTALPFGPGSTATLNASTGLSTYIANVPNSGFYVVAVDVNEYRNINGTEVLVGRTRRDLQLVVRLCPVGNAPVIQSAGGTGNPGGTGGRSFTVEEGQTLTFPINANTNPGGSNLTTRINSVLLDGSGSINASYNGDQGLRPAGSATGTVTVAGAGPVNGTFSFTPSCGMARSTTYDVLTTATVLCTTKSKSEVFQITVTKAAAPTAIAGPTQVCDVAALRTYTATGTSPGYNWHIVGGTIVSGQGTGTVQVRWNSAATIAQLSLKGISAFGCRTDSIVQSVTIRPLANPVVTASAPSICRGASSTLTVTPATGLTYTIAGGAQTVTGTTLTVSPTATTVYTVTASDGTCSSTTQVTVTVTPPPTVTPGAAVTICSGQSATLGAAPVAGLSYSWSPSTGLSNPTIANPTVTLSNNTGTNITQTYTLTVTNAANCVSTGTVVVTVTPPLNVSAGTSVSFCSGQSAQLGAAPIPGLTYSWSPIAGLTNPSVANPFVTLTNVTANPTTTTYTVTATNATGCQATASVNVTVNPGVGVSIPFAFSLCSGDTRQIGRVGPTSPNYTYSWSPTTGLSDPNSAAPVLTGLNTTTAPITTTYILTITTTQGCVGIESYVATVVPLPIANAGANQTLCSGVASAPLGTTAITGNTYSWSPTTGLNSTTAAQPIATLTNTGTAPITQTYTLTVTGPFAGPTPGGRSCTSTSTVTLTVNPAAVVTPGPAVSFCSGQSAQLGVAPVAGTTYSWSPTTGLSSPTVANPTVTLTNTTNANITQTYTLTATTADGCVATGTVLVTVFPAATALPGADRAVCSGIGTTLGAAPVAGNTYRWTPATGLSSATVANPTVTLTNTTGADITPTYTLTTTNAQGCTGTGTVTVTVKSAAVADAGPDLTVCSGTTGLVGTPALPGYVYTWITTPQSGITLNNGSLAQPTFTVTNTSGASFFRILVLQVTAPNGCTGQDQVQITINPGTPVNAGADRTVCANVPTQLGGPVLGIGPAATYSWSPATGLSSTTSTTPILTLPNTTGVPISVVYVLTATTTTGGCVSRDSVTVTVTPAAVVDAGADQTVCADQRLTLGIPAQAGYTYTWTPATGLSSASVAQPVLNTTGLNTTQAPLTLKYYLSAATANGCAGRDSVSITINPRPASASITGSASVCPTVTGVAYVVVNPTGTSYQWLVSGGTIASGQGTPTITVDWGPAGNGLVQLYQVSPLGCSSDTTDFPVRINPILQTATPNGPGNVTAAAPNNAVCQGAGPFTYATTPFTNGSTYAWTIIGGTQVSTNLNTVTVNWNPVTVPTIGKIVVTESSNPASGIRCLGTSDTLRVNINPTPLSTLALTGPARVCQGSPISFTLPGGFAGSTYAFLLDGAAQTATGNTLSLPAQTTAGTYTVSVRETSAQGCAGPLITTTFTVDPTPGAATITGPAFLCEIPTPVQPGIQYSVPNTSGATYQWTVVGGSIESGQGSSQIMVRFTATAPNYSVSVTETSALGCVGSANTLRILRNNPSLALTLASVAETSNNSVILSLNVPNGANTPTTNPVRILRRVAGSGSFAAIGTVPTTATSFTDASADAAANSYEYQLELTNGCGTLVQSIVTQTIRLQATATPGTGGRDQGTVTLSWNAYVGFNVLEYRIYRILDGGTPELLNTVPATTLTATVPNGAANSATGAGFNQMFRVVAKGDTFDAPRFSNSNTASVDFANTVKTYNIITPNNDGLNDVLVFDNITLYPGNSLTIFNRWGREVYNTTNYKNNWGGTDLSAGTYYYLLKLPNGSTQKSWFEIVK